MAADGPSEPPGAQRPETSPVLDGLIGRVLDLVLDDETRANAERVEFEVDRLCSEHPDQAGALRKRVHALQQVGFLPREKAGPKVEVPEELGDFRLLERLGQGGMGVVYLAEQTSLGRQVALKVVRPEHLFFAGARERFQREVEAVARLGHHAIATVYMVGEDRGVPYFAMEYVHGVTLYEALSALRERDPARLTGEDLRREVLRLRPFEDGQAEGRGAGPSDSPIFRGSWVEAVLWIVREVALALGHAHRRGVLHRDLKASNIMLTAEGRVLLLDFGLASLGQEGGGQLTRTGSQMGSLPYMAPEQVAGRWDQVDARTDVYGLGVTLYELLTLALPFQLDDSMEIQQRIVQGRRRPPRQFNGALSVDAETVCLTAMDSERGRRYASADEFAQDLSNVLEHRPIEARRAGPGLRLVRWMQRHPARAMASLLAFLVVVVGPLVFGVQASRAEERIRNEFDAAEKARSEAEDARQAAVAAGEESELARRQAERDFERALRSVDFFLTRIGDQTLARIPQMEGVRQELLEEALSFHEEFLNERSGDERLRRRKASMLDTVARLRTYLGRWDEALDAHLEAAEILRELEPESGQELEQRLSLGWALAHVGTILIRRGELEAAGPYCDEAEQLARGALEAGQRHERSARLLARAVIEGGRIDYAQGRPEQAREAFREALGILRECIDRYGSAAQDLREFTFVANALAKDLRDHRHYEESEDLYRESIGFQELVLARDERELGSRTSLCESLTGLVGLLLQRDRLEEAETLQLQLVEIQERLVREFPRVSDYRVDLAGTYTNRGILFASRGELEQARPYFERSVTEQRELVELRSRNPVDVSKLGAMVNNLARLRNLTGSPEQGLELAREAVALQREALAVTPDEPQALGRILQNQGQVCEALSLLGDHRGLREAAEELRELGRGALEAYADCGRHLATCAGLVRQDSSLTELERGELVARDCAGALESFGRALDGGWPVARVSALPELAHLREHEAFPALARRLGLPSDGDSEDRD